MSDSKKLWSPRGLTYWMAVAEQRGRPFSPIKPRAAKKLSHHRTRRNMVREIAAQAQEVGV